MRLSLRQYLAVIALSLVLLVGVVATFTPKSVNAHGTECYTASYFEHINRGGSGHWRAVAYVQAPVPSIQYWHAHGPSGASLWPDSVSESYGKAYVYFSWPDWLNPAWYYNASDFQACVN